MCVPPATTPSSAGPSPPLARTGRLKLRELRACLRSHSKHGWAERCPEQRTHGLLGEEPPAPVSQPRPSIGHEGCAPALGLPQGSGHSAMGRHHSDSPRPSALQRCPPSLLLSTGSRLVRRYSKTPNLSAPTPLPQGPEEQEGVPGYLRRCAGQLQLWLRPGLHIPSHPGPGALPGSKPEPDQSPGVLVWGKGRALSKEGQGAGTPINLSLRGLPFPMCSSRGWGRWESEAQ